MITAPSPADVALLLGLSFFLGLAYEDFFNRTNARRPGGVRTFPLLALVGGVLYLFDTVRFIPFTGGLLILGSWLIVYYQKQLREPDEEGESNVGLVVPMLNVLAYLLGAITLALPHWFAVASTVTAVLLLTGRTQLHALARRIEIGELVTAGEFLILTGIILPLLPNEPVTTLTKITPRQVWLALVVVCTFSYVSYLAQRYWAAAARGLWMAALGGLYSSTATTVVLARQAKANPALRRQAQAGITLATAIMYLRLEAVVAIFNQALARLLILPLGGLATAGFVLCALQYWWLEPAAKEAEQPAMSPANSANPLQLGPAAIFAVLFIAMSVASSFATTQFGAAGIYALAAIIGFSDIDPFVLNLAQGGAAGVTETAIAAAILIAASSNNVLKAGYAVAFGGGRTTAASAVVLVALAVAGIVFALFMAGVLI
jgi:uncharacterized membrane protein (DUF4010 family)